jgi:phosphopantothenoylcysteine decarboxylase
VIVAKVLLGVTGSVAAIYTRELFEELRGDGHQVRVVATAPAWHFFDPTHLSPLERGVRNPDVVTLDEDEWTDERYQRGDPVLHIELRRWADILVIAPLDANTLAKLAMGICDNCLTCVYRAWDRSRPIVLAPAMNTLMWEHPSTVRHLRQICADLTGKEAPQLADGIELSKWINGQTQLLTVAIPVVKPLACADIGIGAMANRDELRSTISERLRRKSRAEHVD